MHFISSTLDFIVRISAALRIAPIHSSPECDLVFDGIPLGVNVAGSARRVRNRDLELLALHAAAQRVREQQARKRAVPTE
jgi:hypothetical protein